MCSPPGPTLAGFTDFIYNYMQVPESALPSDSPYIGYAYDVAISIVNQALAAVSYSTPGTMQSGGIYALAVYNLGASNLIQFCPDQPDAPNVVNSNPPAPYFANLRNTFHINDFVAGVVQSSGDEGTNQSLVVQEAMKNITIADLQYLKDPYGRQYLAFAQRYGPAVWGVT